MWRTNTSHLVLATAFDGTFPDERDLLFRVVALPLLHRPDSERPVAVHADEVLLAALLDAEACVGAAAVGALALGNDLATVQLDIRVELAGGKAAQSHQDDGGTNIADHVVLLEGFAGRVKIAPHAVLKRRVVRSGDDPTTGMADLPSDRGQSHLHLRIRCRRVGASSSPWPSGQGTSPSCLLRACRLESTFRRCQNVRSTHFQSPCHSCSRA